jgi:8-oxo-dGTP pyrophosphatase MutT (NUDIX family)
MYLYDHIEFKDINYPTDCRVIYVQQLQSGIKMYGVVAIKTDIDMLKQFLLELNSISLYGVSQFIVILNGCIKDVFSYIEDFFELEYSAGGIVMNENHVLMEYHNNLWDLPKGHIEKGELAEEAAVREIKEECGVQVNIIAKFFATYYTLSRQKTDIKVKKVQWFICECLDDTHMTPQISEGIFKVDWISVNEFRNVKMYSSVRLLLISYLNLLPMKIDTIENILKI